MWTKDYKSTFTSPPAAETVRASAGRLAPVKNGIGAPAFAAFHWRRTEEKEMKGEPLRRPAEPSLVCEPTAST